MSTGAHRQSGKAVGATAGEIKRMVRRHARPSKSR
jgi:hypothetical protein